MIGESRIADFAGLAIILLGGAYLDYRIRRRRLETRLAAGILHEHDSPIVEALEALARDGEVTKRDYRTFSVSNPRALTRVR